MICRTPHFLSLQSAAPTEAVALCQSDAVVLPQGDAPEWIRLVPAAEALFTADGRGPYKAGDHRALVERSLQQEAMPMVIDENHATDLAAKRGESAPARGWIVDLEARPDGIWGKVEWTVTGKQLMAERAYRFISPVIRHLKDGSVVSIARASLVNSPNLRGMTALHQENNMDLLAKLLAAIGLPATTTEDQLVEKVTALHAEQANVSTALQAAQADILGPIAAKIGLPAGADQAAVLAGVEQLAADRPARAGDPVVTALQGEIATLATELRSLKEGGARSAAEAYVDGEIRRGRVGVKPLRDDYIAMHMEDPGKAERLIAALPVLGAGNAIIPATPPAREGEIALQSEQKKILALVGVDPAKAIETMKEERASEAL